ncbi:MAG: hypothetical protein A2X46_05080 [Lentisphaerae bacterium GWF2_57_35]|nr:MAG: hypothetical protein A2X46_05080 [Lentisphaerae bacterium GWF2_57_35]
MNQPKVTAIITTFNSERFLKQALDSVLAQAYAQCDILVVDNQSTDRTESIVRSYGSAARFYVVPERCDLATARNHGMRLTRGEYIAFLDADDVWLPGKIARQVAFMDMRGDVPLCHTVCQVIDAEGRACYVRHEGALPPTGYAFSLLLRHNFITISSALVRRKTLEEEGIEFISDPDRIRTGEDNMFFLMLARRHPVGLVNEVLAQYRKYGDSACDHLSWKSSPQNVPLHRHVLNSPVFWKGVVPRSEAAAALVEACLENCVFWRGRGFPGRALYFAALAVWAGPTQRDLWMQCFKSMVRIICPKMSSKAP